VTLPERKQRVQACIRLGEPLITAFTRRTLGFQARLERLWEWDTWIPNAMLFPQMSHLAIMVCTSFFESARIIVTDIASKIKVFSVFLNSFYIFQFTGYKGLYIYNTGGF
jgi:hypothetical protein